MRPAQHSRDYSTNPVTIIRLAAAVALTFGSSRPALAQQPAGALILYSHIGGGEFPSLLAPFHGGATYRLEIRPATELHVFFPATRTAPAIPVPLRPLPAGDSVPGGAGYLVTAPNTGGFILESSAPDASADVRVVLVSLEPGDRLLDQRNVLVFSGSVGPTLTYLELDSGVVYRLVAHHDLIESSGYLYIAPRFISSPPIRIAPVIDDPIGVPFTPALSGEYKIYGDAERAIRIYREDRDQVSLTCARNPRQPLCRGGGRSAASLHRESMLVVMLTTALVAGFIVGDR